jgi:DNA-binding NarL/FixJ family response regulator
MPDSATEIVRTLIVDDHDFFRRGLAQLLTEAGVDVVGEASSGASGVKLCAELAPQVALMDVNMPGISGIEATRQIVAAGRGVQVVMLTISEDDESMIEALLAGAAGYLLKDATLDEIVAAVQAAAHGDAVIPPRVAPEVLRRLRESEPARRDARDADDRRPELSERELDVLRLLAQGKDNAAIAAELYISPNTVKNHAANIFAKLEVENRLQAAVQAVRRGVV